MLPLAALAALALSSAPARAQDFYVSAFTGMLVMDSTVQIGTTKLVDQGGDAFQGGVRAGWGRSRPAGLYLGAEAEVFGASGRSRACVDGQCTSFAVNGGAGAFARVGWRTRGNALFFARGGTQAIFSNQGTQWAPAIGLGAEVPFAPRWFARVDITYAWTGTDQREFYQGSAGVGVRF